MNIVIISKLWFHSANFKSDEDINDHDHICPFHLRLSMNTKTGSLLSSITLPWQYMACFFYIQRRSAKSFSTVIHPLCVSSASSKRSHLPPTLVVQFSFHCTWSHFISVPRRNWRIYYQRFGFSLGNFIKTEGMVFRFSPLAAQKFLKPDLNMAIEEWIDMCTAFVRRTATILDLPKAGWSSLPRLKLLPVIIRFMYVSKSNLYSR